MQWSLFLLILMGQWSFFACHLYEYHFVGEKKTWYEAQKYCRENYIDLATVSNMTDMERLSDTTVQQGEAWIGMYNQTQSNRTWHWSMPGVEFKESETNWNSGEPNDIGGVENCVLLKKDSNWRDGSCEHESYFICYDENNATDKYHLIKEKKKWSAAQEYCRERYTDLVSGLKQFQDMSQKLAVDIQSVEEWMWVWIGLFRDTWMWSDGSSFSFRNWDLNKPGSKKCAMTELNGSGKWSSDDCIETKPFFCYDDKVILIKENKTWEEASYYCRENYSDLVSITNPHQQRWVQERAKNASTDFVWLGLRYTCTLDFWFWVSNDVVNYTNWAPGGTTDICGMSGAMDRGGQHQWFKNLDNNKFNFICSKC
ncbi:macrophage mannose receptor 1-like [Micropterus salmoides]|uniref:macrophage mannose receptor 1-like n=1 Tax=Micropterus salmoides TaxID=27706 RepID=UPI0018EB958F|nr:macrophage mannose receptor 1-like [Micropterus salmoides]